MPRRRQGPYSELSRLGSQSAGAESRISRRISVTKTCAPPGSSGVPKGVPPAATGAPAQKQRTRRRWCQRRKRQIYMELGWTLNGIDRNNNISMDSGRNGREEMWGQGRQL